MRKSKAMEYGIMVAFAVAVLVVGNIYLYNSTFTSNVHSKQIIAGGACDVGNPPSWCGNGFCVAYKEGNCNCNGATQPCICSQKCNCGQVCDNNYCIEVGTCGCAPNAYCTCNACAYNPIPSCAGGYGCLYTPCGNNATQCGLSCNRDGICTNISGAYCGGTYGTCNCGGQNCTYNYNCKGLGWCKNNFPCGGNASLCQD